MPVPFAMPVLTAVIVTVASSPGSQIPLLFPEPVPEHASVNVRDW